MYISTWQDFWTIITVQAIWYGVLCWQFRVGPIAAFINAAICGLIAIPLGVVFDLSVGKYSNIFHYVAFHNQKAFLLANWVFSYGFAIASIRVVPIFEKSASGKKCRPIGTFLFLIAAIGLYQLPTHEIPTLLVMYLAGFMILVASESIFVVSGQKGPILLLAFGIYGPFLKLLGFSMVTGLIYEVANYITPLWVWYEQNPATLSTALQIIGLGYFVLFHASFTAYLAISSVVIYGKSCLRVRKY